MIIRVIRGSSKWLAPKIKKSVDTLQRIPLKGEFTSGTSEGKNKETALKRAGRFNKSHHLVQAPPHEKEIHFSICVL